MGIRVGCALSTSRCARWQGISASHDLGGTQVQLAAKGCCASRRASRLSAGAGRYQCSCLRRSSEPTTCGTSGSSTRSARGWRSWPHGRYSHQRKRSRRATLRARWSNSLARPADCAVPGARSARPALARSVAPAPGAAGVPCVEERRKEDERQVDGWQVIREPARQVEVSDRCMSGAEMTGDIGERASEAVTGEDQGLGCDHASRDGGAGRIVP